MPNKYEWLTKEMLQDDYEEFGSFKLISIKRNIPQTTLKSYYKKFKIKTTPKISYSCNDKIFSTDTEFSFYLAGFIAADGCISQNKSVEPNYMSICLSKKDESHLLKLKNVLEFTGPIKTTTSYNSKLKSNWNDVEKVAINIYSKPMINDLKRFDIGPRKSLTYNFPNWLTTHDLVNHFMRGYADGDGSFFLTKWKKETKKFGTRIYSKLNFSLRGTNNFLSSFKDVLSKNNINTLSIPKFNNGIDQLKYSGNIQVSKISKFLYKNSNIFLQRKYDIIKELL